MSLFQIHQFSTLKKLLDFDNANLKSPYFISSISFPNESVEHFFDIFFIIIRFYLPNVLITGESNFDEKNVEEMFN